jgi:hypothetical protein
VLGFDGDDEGRVDTGPNGSINCRLAVVLPSPEEGDEGVLLSDDSRSFNCFDDAPE